METHPVTKIRCPKVPTAFDEAIVARSWDSTEVLSLMYLAQYISLGLTPKITIPSLTRQTTPRTRGTAREMLGKRASKQDKKTATAFLAWASCLPAFKAQSASDLLKEIYGQTT